MNHSTRKKSKQSVIKMILISMTISATLFTSCSKNKETSQIPAEKTSQSTVSTNEDNNSSEELNDPLVDSPAQDKDVVSVVKSVSQSVVSINVTSTKEVSSDGKTATNSGAGSGFIVKEDSTKIYIVTNFHVIKDANSITISMDNEKEAKATFLGGNEQSDLAVISTTKKNLEKAGINGYAVATLGDSDIVEVGEYVVAIGNALGEGKTVTDGIVGAKNKEIEVDNKKLSVMQTNAAINQGNSGGPLSNMKGEIIGINTAKLTSDGVEGMGYSIPMNSAKTVMDEIMTNPQKTVKKANTKPSLGVKGITVTTDMMNQYNFPAQGVYVAGTVKNSGSANAGLKKGDVSLSALIILSMIFSFKLISFFKHAGGF